MVALNFYVDTEWIFYVALGKQCVVGKNVNVLKNLTPNYISVVIISFFLLAVCPRFFDTLIKFSLTHTQPVQRC